MLLAIVVSLLAGGIIGFVALRRLQRSTPPTPSPVRAEETDDVGSVLRIAADELELGVVVADSSDP